MTTATSSRRSLVELFAGLEAVVEHLAGNEPIRLDVPGTAWLIDAGKVEIFAYRTEGDDAGRRDHVVTVEAGEMIFGVASPARRPAFGAVAPNPATPPAALLAVGLPGTRLRRTSTTALTHLAQDDEHVAVLVAGIERWLANLFAKVPHKDAPQHYRELRAGAEVQLDAEINAGRVADGVVWVRHVEGTSFFLGRSELALDPDTFLVPISDETWLVAPEGATLSCVATAHLLRSGNLWEGLRRFHELFLRYLELRRVVAGEEDRGRLERKLALDQSTLELASARLAAVLGGPRRQPIELLDSADALLAVCRLVGERQGIHFRPPPPSEQGPSFQRQKLERICAASRVRSRRVVLRGDWWQHDNGPLLAFLSEPETDASGKELVRLRPVALLPTSPTSYAMTDPRAGEPVAVDEAVAERLDGTANMFFEPLPERPVAKRDLIRVAFSGQRRELLTIVTMGTLGGLLALLVPIITAQIFGWIVPVADRSQLAQMTLALVVAALASAAFQITRSLAVLRLTGKLDGALQAAVLDRLLRLPTTFFRRYTVGDLATRALGVDAIRGLLLGNVTTALLGIVFSLFSLGLLFYYSWRLALVACGLLLLLALLTVLLTYSQLRWQRLALASQGRIASVLFGFIRGIGKLRISGSQAQAYAQWTLRFAEQRRSTIAAQRIANLQAGLNAVYPVLATLGIFATLGLAEAVELEVSRFLAFFAAYGQLQAASLTFIPLLSSLLTIVPIYERLEPLLVEAPEVDESKAEAGELSGDVEFSHVSFRYHADGPLILDDVSFRARPGEFIALVGPSGSGKSTCVRLLLGFEQPSSGSLYFDGQDLPSLDIQSVRRQIGVVLQNSQPLGGDIFRNIVGSSNANLEAAWEAARMAGLEDDIKAMPMGMHTVVSESAGTFSGGQIQRLMIARAVIHRPRILIFDEATSALDNRTQEHVSRSLERLKATRIVVAHRLSTIKNADCIYVIDRGRVVESGSYDELVERGGIFSELAARQVV